MRLSTRTGLAAFAATSCALLVTAVVFQGQFGRVLQARVDDQLESRADTAPILVAIADRLQRSELNGTVEGTRVLTDGRTIEVGQLPDDPLPAITAPGWETVSADGERWRLLTIEVLDVPHPGDRALAQLAAPLGDVDSQARVLRRRAFLVGLLVALAAGLGGYLFGRVATRPLTTLRRDADRLDDANPATWQVATDYGSPEVDDVAATLNHNFERLANETDRRGAALNAARAFAASAAHELRTPLQSALTNLDIARSQHVDPTMRSEVLQSAQQQLQRMGSSLAGVKALAEAEFADPSWFEPTDLAELVDAAVAGEIRRGDAWIEIVTDPATPGTPITIWADGARLAIGNVVRNALLHGRPTDGRAGRVQVTIAGSRVIVDDDGPGIPVADRDRMLQRFERGPGGGSGLGLAIARQVAVAHGGSLTISSNEANGTRIQLTFGPETAPLTN
jgi:two-component system sensor histidine kinase PrrB